MNTTVSRKQHMDVLRIIAILCVIYNHTSERGYYYYAITDNYFFSILYTALAAFIAIAVPVFFMISGALLLPKEESYEKLFKKRVAKIVAVIFIFSILQYVYLLIFRGVELSASYFLKNTISDNIISPYWYLYSYLAYLLILPFLRKLVTVMEKRDYHYLFLLLLVVEGALMIALYPLNITKLNPYFVIPFLNRVVVYPLLGYYMEYIFDKNMLGKNPRIKACIIIVATLAVFVVMTKIRNLPLEEFTRYDKGLFTCSFTMLMDASVYFLIKDMCERKPLKNERIISALGKGTFGVYLLEQPVRYTTEARFDVLVPYIGRFATTILWIVAVFIICELVTLCYYKIKQILLPAQ